MVKKIVLMCFLFVFFPLRALINNREDHAQCFFSEPGTQDNLLITFTNNKEQQGKIMHIIVGSTNQIKVAAVTEIIKEYQILAHAKVIAIESPSCVADQPLSLEETINGAKNRAQHAFQSQPAHFGFGIESGLFPVPQVKTGYMTVCACAIYDGKEFYVGLSSAFESPVQITKLIVTGGLTMAQAFNKTGVVNNPKLGSTGGGAVGLLTKGRVDRVAYSKQAVIMAMIELENAELFKRLS